MYMTDNTIKRGIRMPRVIPIVSFDLVDEKYSSSCSSGISSSSSCCCYNISASASASSSSGVVDGSWFSQ